MKGLRIVSMGSSLPEKVVTNDDLSKIVDTSDGFQAVPELRKEESAQKVKLTISLHLKLQRKLLREQELV